MADSGKRKSGGGGGGGEGGKNKKAKYFSSVKAAAIPAGSRGVLVSCVSGKEFKAAMEAIRLLTEYYEAACPGGVAAVEAAAADTEAAAASDVSSLLESELAELKAANKTRLFTFHKTNVAGLVYISLPEKCDGPGPTELVAAAAADAKATKQCKARLCLRFLPVEVTCYASLEEISATAKKYLAAHFPSDADAASIPFAVEYEHRASTAFKRMDVINAVVDQIATPPHKVNLTKPTKTVLVQLLKNSCGLSVVEGYKEHLKFNLRELCSLDEEEAQAQAAGGSKAAPASKAPAAEPSGGRDQPPGKGGDGAAAGEGAPAAEQQQDANGAGGSAKGEGAEVVSAAPVADQQAAAGGKAAAGGSPKRQVVQQQHTHDT